MALRRYIVGIVFFVLLIWGPIDHSWTAWIIVRVSYLIIIPILFWYILKYIWYYCKPSIETEDRFERALTGATSGVLTTLAIIEASSKTHIGNSMRILTRDGWEDVGNDVILQGANWGGAIVLFFFAAIAFWYSVSKK